jgi:hypothetical protein
MIYTLISFLIIIIIIKLLFYSNYEKITNNKFYQIAKIVVIHNPLNNKTFQNIQQQQKYFQFENENSTSQINFIIVNQIKTSDIYLDNYNIKYPWYSIRYNEANINDKLNVEKEEVSNYLNYFNLFNDFANYSNQKNSSIKSWFLILNDNFNIIPNKFGEKNMFLDNLSKLIENLPNDTDIVFLGYSNDIKCGKNVNNFVCFPTLPINKLNGFLVTKESSEKLYKLMEYIDVPIENKINQLIIENKIRAYIVKQPMINSLDL